MGFLGEIERIKQQQIQQELTRKASLEASAERQRQLAEEQRKRVAINAERIERDAISFIQDRSTITGLLGQLNEFGYRGYFEEVARISGFELGWVLYTRYPGGYESSANPAVLKQQEEAHKKLKDASAKLNWPKLLEGKTTRHPGHAFFNDKVTTVEEKKFTEPQEVGIGIRFLKKAVRTDLHRNRLAELLGVKYKSPTEKWDHAVYIRIDSRSRAIITGSNQRQVDLKDLRLFDEVLEQAIHNPAIIHTIRMEIWMPPRPPRQKHNGESPPGNGY